MSVELRDIFQKHYNYHDIEIYTPTEFKQQILRLNPNVIQEAFLNLPTGFDVTNFEEFFYPIYPEFHIMMASKRMYSRSKHLVVAFYEKPGLLFIPLPDICNENINSITQELEFVLNHRYFSELKQYNFVNLLQIANERFHNVFTGLLEPKYENNILCKNLLEIIVTETYDKDKHILNLKLFTGECIIKQKNFVFEVNETNMKHVIQEFLLPFNLTKEEIKTFDIKPELTTEFCQTFVITDAMRKAIK